MPLLLLAYLGFVGIGLPEGMLGVAWPQMREDFGVPLGAVGFLLVAGTACYIFASVTAGFTLDRFGVGWLLAASTGLAAAALAGIGLAPGLLLVVVATLGLGAAHGAIDTGLNAYVARHYGARHLSWLHASFGLGATVGPLVMTGVLAAGLVWRWGYGVEAVAVAVLAVAYLGTTRSWIRPGPVSAPGAVAAPGAAEAGQAAAAVDPARVFAAPGWRTLALPGLWLGAATFVVQVAIEIGAGLWAYTLLTQGRGVAAHLAGIAVSGYWGSMFAGRIIAGAVADRIGVHRVLTAGVAGTAVGAALVALPGPGWLAAAGFLLLGLAGAPMFPLLTLTTAERVGPQHADRTIGVQVGASALGGALVPTGIGVLMGRLGPEILGPCLVLLALVLAVLYASLRRVRAPVTPRGPAGSGGT